MTPIEIKFLKQQIKSAQRIIDKHPDTKVIKVAEELIAVNTKLIEKLRKN